MLIAEELSEGANGHALPPPAPRPRQFVFDRPFLVLLQEAGAGQPYFAASIGNTLMVDR